MPPVRCAAATLPGMRALLSWLMLSLPCGPLVAQAPPAGERVACRTCDSAGSKPCPKHKKAMALEQAAHACRAA